jgi:hypothetical protein
MSAVSAATLSTSEGAPLAVERELARGGQGAIFEVAGDRGVVLKRYYERELDKDRALEERLRLMLELSPHGWREARSGHLLLAWPSELAYDRGEFVGFLMPRLDMRRMVELHRVTDPSDRTSMRTNTGWLGAFTWRDLVAVAKHLALVTEQLHESDVVIGDFNDRNVAVSERGRVTLFDCDSMQIADRVSKRWFLCRVRRAEFLAPELHDVDLAKVVRPVSSDLFALAVHLHQLLLEGEHPFRGSWNGGGDPPKEAELARRGLWTHAGYREVGPRRAAIDIDLLPDDLIEMFREAFVEGATKPGARPDAARWCQALDELAGSLVQCRAVREHWYPRVHRSCPWCAHALAHPRVRRQATANHAMPGAAAAFVTGTTAWAPPAATAATTATAVRPAVGTRLHFAHAATRARRRMRAIVPAVAVAGYFAGSYTFSTQPAQPNGVGEGLLWCGACALVAMIVASLYDLLFGPARARRSGRDVALTSLGALAGVGLWRLSFHGPDPSALGWLAPALLMALGHGAALAWVGSGSVGVRLRVIAAAVAVVLGLACASSVLGAYKGETWLSQTPLATGFQALYEDLAEVVGIRRGVPLPAPKSRPAPVPARRSQPHQRRHVAHASSAGAPVVALPESPSTQPPNSPARQQTPSSGERKAGSRGPSRATGPPSVTRETHPQRQSPPPPQGGAGIEGRQEGGSGGRSAIHGSSESGGGNGGASGSAISGSAG